MNKMNKTKELSSEEFPWYFITTFSSEDLALYQKAIQEYAKEVLNHGLEIDLFWECKYSKGPALVCFSEKRDLSRFWRIFEKIKEQK